MPAALAALAALAGLALAAAPLAAQARAQEDGSPTAEQILARMQRATHGKAADAARNVVMRGTSDLYMSGVVEGEPFSKGKLAITLSADGDALDAREYPPMGEWTSGEHAGTTWMTGPFRGARVIEGTERGAMRRGRALLTGRPWRGLYGSAEVTGEEELGGRAHYVLSLPPIRDGGEPDVLYVDQETWLPSRWTYVAPLPDGNEARMQLDNLDWRAVDGVMYPFETRLLQGTVMARQVFTEIRHAEELEPGLFALPDAVVEAREARAAEAKKGQAAFTVQRVPERHCAAVTVTIRAEEISKSLAVILPEVLAYLNEVGAGMTGPPYTRYHDIDGEKMTMEAGMPVREPIEGRGRIQPVRLPAGRAVVGWHVGPYHELGTTHEAMSRWAAEQGHEAAGGPWEVYWTDPGLEPDPSKWRTQIFLPIQ